MTNNMVNNVNEVKAGVAGSIPVKPFVTLAFIGFFAALAVHIASFFGFYFKGAFVLHIGMLVVFIPAVMTSPRYFKTLRPLLKYAPKWLVPLVFLTMLYAGLNFMLNMGNLQGGGPHIMDGKYVVANHGEIIKEITKETYHWMQAYQARLFSGLWMPFYLASAMLLTIQARKRAAGE